MKEKSWWEDAKVEIDMSGEFFRLVSRAIIERDRTRYTEEENKKLDEGWAVSSRGVN